MTKSFIDINLDEFKEEFLSTVVDEVHNIESSVLKLEKKSGEELSDQLYDIFRRVHSLKGSSGVYEFHMLAIIFHRFEDYLNLKIKGKVNDEFIDFCLRYLDIIKNCVADYKSKNSELDKYSSVIEDLLLQDKRTAGKIALVDSTQSIRKIFSKITDDNNLDLTLLANGESALHRLIHERFDLIVVSRNIDIVDGDSLLKGLRVMKNINQKTPMILISSDDDKDLKDKDFKYDFISKSINLMQEVDQYVKEKIVKKLVGRDHLDFKFKNILIAEDDILIQKIVTKIFQKFEGVKITLTDDLVKSLKAIETEKPDLIILDYFLRGCTGIDILEQHFKKHGKINTPILFMTSTPEKIKISDLRSRGNIKGIIEKPIKVRHFVDDITRIIEDNK